MKLRKLFLILFAFILFITGCEDDSQYSELPTNEQTEPDYESDSNTNALLQWTNYFDDMEISSLADCGDFIWFTTGSEVYRFTKQTGKAMHFDFGEIEFPSNYNITTIKCDINGLPWIGAEYTGTLKMTEEGRWMLLPQECVDNEFEKGTHEILISKNGTIWTSTINKLSRYQEDAVDHFTTNGTIISLAEDIEENIWIGTAKFLRSHYDGLVKYDGEHWTIYNSSSTGSKPLAFNSIIVDNNGTLWMAGYNGIDDPYTNLVEFDGLNWNVYSPPFNNLPFYINEIAIDSDGVKWLSTNKGLVAFNGSEWITYNTSNSEIPSNSVHQIIIDTEGIIWIATEKGLSALNNVGKSE